MIAKEDIRRPVHWAIDKPEHTGIVHLGGVMRELDTEIEGAGSAGQPPSPGDIWLVPANWRYASQAREGVIQYAELRLAPDAR